MFNANSTEQEAAATRIQQVQLPEFACDVRHDQFLRNESEMKIPDALHESFRACEGAALALSHVLRPTATKLDPPQNVLSAFQEAQAFSITCRAVMDEAAPILPHLASTARCAGKFLARATSTAESSAVNNTNHTTICNGYDSLAVILIMLFDNASQAILDVAANHSRWLVTPLQASVCFDRMVTHHGQLRGFYGIIHLAAKISAHTSDTLKTLFVDIDENTDSEMQPSKWRAAIKLDDFYGRHFGFHYTPEMRNVLRVVNIARGSVLKSHNERDGTPQLIKNAFMLGWGWIYSNMVIMDNLGLTIDGVSQIGADISPDTLSIEQLRKFMNLVEEPLVAGVSGLTGVDVAMDTSFEIPPPGEEGGVEIATSATDDVLHDVLVSITDPVRVRLMSLKHRPGHLSKFKNRSRNTKIKKRTSGLVPVHVKGDDITGDGNMVQVVSSIDILDEAHIPNVERGMQQFSGNSSAINSLSLSSVPSTGRDSEHAGNRLSNGKDGGSNTGNGTLTSSSFDKRSSMNGEERHAVDGERMDNSFLASTIKTEFQRFQSNVSNFLGIEEKKPASGLILYFHGGGFVSQSSESHMAYLKEWCCDISDMVLLSVDYKLAPEHKFPTALHECLYAYIWALQNASVIGTLAERVVFAGDSAGGNFAVATAMKVAQLGIRAPDGLCVSYPALYLTTAWSPSRLLSFFDPMLPVSVLELCLKSYIPDGIDATKHAFISPIVAGDKELGSLGPVTVICGSLDPLLDDAAVFAQRLHELRDGDTFKVYESMPHGFLNMSQVNGTARAGMRFLAKMMAQYLGVPLRRRNEDEEEEELERERERERELGLGGEPGAREEHNANQFPTYS